jgi:hypothetical protein
VVFEITMKLLAKVASVFYFSQVIASNAGNFLNSRTPVRFSGRPLLHAITELVRLSLVLPLG